MEGEKNQVATVGSEKWNISIEDLTKEYMKTCQIRGVSTLVDKFCSDYESAIKDCRSFSKAAFMRSIKENWIFENGIWREKDKEVSQNGEKNAESVQEEDVDKTDSEIEDIVEDIKDKVIALFLFLIYI